MQRTPHSHGEAADPILALRMPHRPMAVRHGVDLALIETPEGFEALADEWESLLSRVGRATHVFQTFAWNWHWTRHYLATDDRRGPRLAIVTGRIDGRLVLIAPLVVQRRAGLRQLGWMGEPVSQYGDVVAEPAHALPQTIAAALRFAAEATGADLACLRKVRSDSLVAPALRHLSSRITATEDAPFVELNAPDYEAFKATQPAKRRKNRARQARRLQMRGALAFEAIACSPQAAHLAAYAILLKRTTLRQKGQISPSLADPRFSAFFADIARGGVHPVGCRVFALRSAGELAAIQIAIDHARSRFLHVTVFAGKFDKCGAGNALLEHTIRDSFEQGHDRFDLLAPRHEYKMEFATGAVAVDDHVVAMGRAGALYAHLVLGSRGGIKRGIERLPAPLRRTIDGALALLRR